MGPINSALGGLLASASKLTFILLTITACSAFLLGSLESKDFMLLAISAYSFYYSNKGDTGVISSRSETLQDGTTAVTTVSTPPPFAGK